MLLKSPAKLKSLIKEELRADAAKYGDDRRSPLVQREAAQALDESALVASEPVTVVLSQKGWIARRQGPRHRCRRLGLPRRRQPARRREGPHHATGGGHRFHRPQLFHAGAYAALGTWQRRTADRPFHADQRARVSTPSTAGDNDTRLILATDFGYGFVTRFEALTGRNKAGKQIITLSDDAHVLAPQVSADPARDRIVVVTTEGHLLMFSVAELPELDKGKGNKLIEMPKAKLVSGDERVAGIAVVTEGKGEVTLFAGQRKLTLKWSDLVEYGGNRATRGGLLPRGLRRVERIETTA